MIKIFSYGTLHDGNVQVKEFGKTFYMENDLDFISGWDLVNVKINGSVYPVAVESSRDSIISGVIIHIPEDIIGKVDEYETKAYERINITTLCGDKCQMYVKRTN